MNENDYKHNKGCADVLLVFVGLMMASTAIALSFGPNHPDWDSPEIKAATYPDSTEVDSTFVPESQYVIIYTSMKR